ncbi:hypothetical protein [Microbaculum marinum]|uniref:ABC transmembrane type-1 domain-containing protein n=1 Tax=Microbaculum marinum TaxID=1764581 RepID=A0AAW9RSF5_9HYPH
MTIKSRITDTKTYSSVNSGYRIVATRTRRYLESLRWLIGRLMRVDRTRVLVIIGLTTAGRFMQMGAFAGVIWYFVALENNKTIDFLTYSVDPRGLGAMALVVAFVTVVLIAATVLIYKSVVMSFDVGVTFAKHVLVSTMTLENAWPVRRSLASTGTMSVQAHDLCRERLRLFRPVQTLLSLPRHLLLAVLAIGGMLYTSATAVGILSLLAVPALIFNYRISRAVVIAQRDNKVAVKEYRREAKHTLNQLGNERKLRLNRATMPERLVEGDANRNAFRAFGVRIMSPPKSEFVANVLSAIAIAIIGLYLGYEAISGAMPLALVIGFFVLLRLAMSGLTGFTVSLTSYARFYETIRNAYEYLTSPLQEGTRFAGRVTLRTPKTAAHLTAAVEEDVELKRGVPIAVISPAEPNRYTQYFFAQALGWHQRLGARRKLNASTIVCTTALAEPSSLQERGIAAVDPDALAQKLAGTAAESFAPSGDVVNKALAGYRRLQSSDHARIGMLVCLLSSADHIVFDAKLIKSLDEKERLAWLSVFSDRYITVAYNLDNVGAGLVGEELGLVLDYERLLGLIRMKDAEQAALEVKKSWKKPVDSDEDEDSDIE